MRLRIASAALALLALSGPVLAQDKRATRALTLDNGLEVFLVSDPGTDRSAAALAVNAGSMNDGEYGGIAHFLEHMLFLGTKKYPKAGDYNDYLAANEGGSNAYTAYDHTNYFFQVKNSAFEGALDRFSRFFIDPLMTDELSAREVNAVDSEHSKNLEDDFWRARQVFRSLINPAHPHNNFATGSRATLSGVQNKTLREFYARTYSSHLMHLAVVSNRPLDQLEAWARAKFSAVPRRDIKALRPSAALFHDGIAGKRLEIKTLRDLRQLWIRFEVPGMAFDHKSKPGQILGALIGHEGQESVLQQLKEEGLATGLSAGPRALGQQGTFNITVTLTEQGLKKVDAVAERVFGMINHLQGMKAFPESFVAEEQKMAAIDFRFRQVASAESEAQSLAAAMIQVPHENLLENLYLIAEPKPAAVKELVDALRPERALLVVLSKDRSTDKKETHYGAEYRLSDIAAETLARFQSAKPVGRMGVPAPNAFIPTDFSLVEPVHAAKPEVYASKFGEVWLRHDVKFKQPKAALQLEIQNRNAASARSFVLGQLMAAAINEALTPYTYPMSQAGVSLGVSSERDGFTIAAAGYSHKLPELLTFAAGFLTEPRISEERFEVIRKNMILAIKNKAMQGATAQAIGVLQEILREVHFNDEQVKTQLEALRFADLKKYFAESRQAIALRGFVYGNLTADQVRALTDGFLKELAPAAVLPEAERYVTRVIRLKKGTSLQIEKEVKTNDSCTLLIYAHDELDEEGRAALSVLNLLLPNKFFQDLRTLQQTGYIVAAQCVEIEGVPFLYFLSQSSGFDTDSLRGRFESFLKHQLDELDDMKDKDFEAFKEGALARLQRKRKTFEEELGFNITAAFDLYGDFGFVEKRVAALKALSKERFIARTRSFLAEQGARRLSVEIIGSAERHKFQKADVNGARQAAEAYRARPKPKAKTPSGQGG